MQSEQTISRTAFDEMSAAYRKSIRVRDEAAEENMVLKQKLAVAGLEIAALKARIAELEAGQNTDLFANE